ncbi:DUF1345 domain-containing protein [Roseococcus sp. YIM B11640]|uniref:DUF1345 domain-containing protein n=1 Tax=Roseococcus sp. YIM B11640 TaxID=3133973 RepID=UPI003C7BB4B7
MIRSILRHVITLKSVAGGLLLFLGAWSAGVSLGTAAMLGWSAHVVFYAALLIHHLGQAEPEQMRRRARDLAEGRATVLVLSVLAASASMLTVVLQLAGREEHELGGLVVPILTIVLSWFYVHLLFAQDYAHEYWTNDSGIEFPGGDGTPEFSEFLYFAFTIGMTFQVSDVTTSAPRMRRLVILHGLTAFWFNAAIIASAVNTVASLAS